MKSSNRNVSIPAGVLEAVGADTIREYNPAARWRLQNLIELARERKALERLASRLWDQHDGNGAKMALRRAAVIAEAAEQYATATTMHGTNRV